ncbi:helix-turn-helix domain-containing protein [Domibacillus sp. A3M-37]|uniref:helix-turn-helix domain-containing protein n=1 Tax=Domibacillus sp. A3M-37 TaxID=2962037 RepID=UPI0020B8086D|nr:helix-turn-helix transcriptional regulator [Domibacillus sp. A3M-37]MCP3761387.1 helix-turn-helix domain-containing protein [Domibacillus sp. A3M-37]
MELKAKRRESLVVKADKPAAGQRISKEENKFVQNIVRERKKRRITQKDLEKMTGLDQAAIGRLETMRVNPTLKTIIKVLNAMDMKLMIVDKE